MNILDKLKKKKKDKEQVKKTDEVKVDKKTEEKKTKGHWVKKTEGQPYKYLIRPVTSEKATNLGIYNQYVFEVAPNSNKIEIKKAIENLYGVKPIKINISNMRGKNVKYGKNLGRLKNWKKAVVILKSGDKIDVYEGV